MIKKKLGPATYDNMAVKPRSGQKVRITYEAEWACWDSIQRPVTKPAGDDTSRFIGPRNSQIEILHDLVPLEREDLAVEYFHTSEQLVNEEPAGVYVKHKPTGFAAIEGAPVKRLENMRVAIERLTKLVNDDSRV